MLCGFVIGLTRRLRSEESRQERAERRQKRKKNHAVKAEEKARNRAAKKQTKAEQKADKKATAGRENEVRRDKSATGKLVDDEAGGHDVYDAIQDDQDVSDNEDTIHRP